jgi:hypothetical protein
MLGDLNARIVNVIKTVKNGNICRVNNEKE